MTLLKKSFCKNLDRQDYEGKQIIVTGATGIIGQEIVKGLLSLGSKVIMAVRNVAKGEIFKRALEQQYSYKDVQVLKLDVSSISSIDAFIEAIESKNIVVNGLINNAGTFNLKDSFSPDGFEIHFATNFLGPLYLSLKMLPILNKNKNSCLIFQNSFSYALYKINWKNIENIGTKNAIKTYSNTKRLTVLSMFFLRKKLEKDFENIKIVFAHPGVVCSNIISQKNSKFSHVFSSFAKFCLRSCCHSAKTGALPCIKAISSSIPSFSNIVPRGVSHIWGKPKTTKIYSPVIKPKEIEKAGIVLFEYINKIKDLKSDYIAQILKDSIEDKASEKHNDSHAS